MVNNLIGKINYIFDKKEKFKLLFLFLFIFLSAFLEMLGITAIVPFISAILMPDELMENKYIAWVYSVLSLESTTQLVILIAVGIVCIYIFKNLFLLVGNYLQHRFVFYNQKKTSQKMLEAYMREPYLFFTSHNSAELRNNISSDVDTFFVTITTVLQFLSEAVMCVGLLAFLFYTDKSITIGVAIMMGAFMVFFIKIYKPRVRRYGDLRRKYVIQMGKWLDQAFGGIKEIKIINREKFFIDSYVEAQNEYIDNRLKYTYCSVIPKPVLETACITGIFAVVIFKICIGVDVEYFITTLSVFVLAAYKMMPSVSKMVSYFSSIMFNKAAVDALYKDLKELEAYERQLQIIDSESEKNIEMKKEICIRDLSFKYPEMEKMVFENVNMSIPHNKSVAFIGPSGAGKTTLADIILGVLEPTAGKVFADGVDVFSDVRAWHKSLGYIPQTIYLMDDTIRKNIAFGLSDKEIEDDKIWEALEGAQLRSYIDELPDGLDTIIGERGVRLSGGQRQRIGIARALYTNPDILVLDEATSALDNDTEKAVMEAIDNLAGKKTLIIIAHRLTTIQNCNIVYEIKDGKVIIKE